MKNTPHINLLNDEGFSKTVLMPGDPLRTKMIAENFLENFVLINDVRGALGYTGFYKGKKISVMTSGMGIPSMCIYAHELYSFFGVENIIRIGSAGALSNDLKIHDIVAAIAVNTDSNIVLQFSPGGTIAPTCSYELLCKASESAEEMGCKLKIGNFFCTDSFYSSDENYNRKWSQAGSIAVEMESAGLYLTAMKNRKKALAICTVSDLPLEENSEGLSASQRQDSFSDMIKIALETAIKC